MVRTGKIFKLCRVHNIIDYLSAIENGVNMIGIHAVYDSLESYKKTEECYSPIDRSIMRTTDTLPISDYETNGIRHLIDKIDNNVQIVLVFEKLLDYPLIKQCIELYNLKSKDILLQFQFRIDHQIYLRLRKYCKYNLICVIGLNQLDFEEYFEKLNNYLDAKKDYILVDFSKHQPDYLTNSMDISSKPPLNTLKSRINILKRNNIPLLIADDTEISEMKEYVKLLTYNNIEIAGLDMQNAVELKKKEQYYRLKKTDRGQFVQIRVRKSQIKLKVWKDFAFENFSLDEG
ncbi:TPA: hypothetical protein R1915_001472 [Staphylococcus delphini]|nr:hypothetical protein [Staphylococcus delphini]